MASKNKTTKKTATLKKELPDDAEFGISENEELEINTAEKVLLLIEGESKSLSVTIIFNKGAGKISALIFRDTELIAEKENMNGGTLLFNDVKPGDELSIIGACSGNAVLTTDWDTTPASSVSSPRKYVGDIFDSLGIN